MGLNSREDVKGRGGKGNFHPKNRHPGGMINQGPMFRPCPPGMFCPPSMGYPPQMPFRGSNFLHRPRGGHFPPTKSFEKFPQKNFRTFPFKGNEGPVFEVDLSTPWVTEEIKSEESKKENLLTAWKMSQNDEDWNKYKAQKFMVQSLYQKAKAEYIASHPDQATYWQNIPHLKKLYCETCDKSFRSDDDLIIHESEHETCGRDGCQFTAHPKIVSKHIKMQHDSGLYQRIGKLYTKEDISKWIEERKKRYPTRKVVEEKKAMEEEKMNRGERIKEDDSKFNKSFKNRNKSGVKKNFEKKIKSKNRRQKKKKKIPPPVQMEEEVLPTERIGVPAFQGIKDPSEKTPIVEEEEEAEKENDLNISDEEWAVETNKESAKPIINSSLGLLATVYDSDEETRDVESTQKKERVSDDEGSAPEEVATEHRKSPAPDDAKEKKASQKRKFLDKNIRQRKRTKYYSSQNNSETRSLTLLEKLLKDEIRHERNVILQCVHYVVKNNFFKT